MDIDELDYDLGDPQFRTKQIISDPPMGQEFLSIYKKYFKIDLTNPDKLIEFFQTDQFLDWYCEYDFPLFMERFLEHTVKPFHVEWFEMLSNHQNTLVWAPRDHGKTHFWSKDYPIWIAYYKKARTIIIMSDTLPQAQEILSDEDSLKEQIEFNEKLWHLKPPSSQKWSERSVQLSNGVRIKAAGFMTRIRGKHPDVIIMDDILSDQNCITKELRDKSWRYYARTIDPMAKKNTQVRIVGTAQHPTDLLHKLANTEKYQSKKYKAIISEDRQEVLWPEKKSYDDLMQYRRDFGELSYQQEYQNNPMSDNLSFFPEILLKGCIDENLSYLPRYTGDSLTFFGGDLSPPGGSKEGDGDFTVFVALEKQPTNALRLLHYVQFRDTPNSYEPFLKKQMEAMTHMAINYQIDHGYLEEVGFQSIYTKEFLTRGTDIPIKGFHVSSQGKRSFDSGIPYLRGLMEKRMIIFPYKTDFDKKMTNELMRQFQGVIRREDGKIGNMAYHDDIVTAIWMAVESSKQLGRAMYTGTMPNFRGGYKGPKLGFIRRKRGRSR